MNTAVPQVFGSSASEEGIYLKIADTLVPSQIHCGLGGPGICIFTMPLPGCYAQSTLDMKTNKETI